MLLDYRFKTTIEKIGPLELRIRSIEDLNRTIDDLFEKLEREGNPALLEELCPYFGVVWASARALAERIAEIDRSPATAAPLAGRRVLELGCGLALPSLVAARLGASVVATDFHPEVGVFLRENLALNGLSIDYRELDWKSPEVRLGAFELVIASDVLYERHQPAILAAAIERHLAPGGVAWVADPARPYLQPFVDEMTRLGFRHETEIRRVPDEPVAKEVFLLRFER